MKKGLEEIALEDGRYSPEAFKFVYEGLGSTVSGLKDIYEDIDQPHHISGQELCKGLINEAKNKWGLLGRIVLEHWGIKKTRDLGEIVYVMIEHEWMSKQPEDSIEDFDEVYDLETVFEKDFKLQ